jgi:signal transduction histidine kinase
VTGVSWVARIRRSSKWPSRWPIRWKLASVSAGLTFVILVAFGLAVGQYTTTQLRDNYAAETQAAAEDLASQIEPVEITPGYVRYPAVDELLREANGPARLTLFASGLSYAPPGTPQFGPTNGPGIRTVGDYQVSTVFIYTPQSEPLPVGYVEFGRDIDRLDQSIGRVWISVLAGTLGATLLAAMAGVVLSRRAMRPVSTLTSAASEIARTRDPSVTLNEPVADDEVAELTRTFNGMLHELTAARSERERSLARQREFIADASHELRTPLTSVLANLELLDDALEGSASREMEKESVESALRSSRRMRRLVADLQILARADSGRKSVHQTCDLSKIAANAVEELRPLSDGHDIEVDLGSEAPVSGIPDDLHRVVINLVDNAVRHTPEGTTIRVAVSSSEADGTATLRVSDDGPGIPEDVRRQIFDRFVRSAGPGDRAKSNGSGLGLAIVQAIAVEHGGEAEVGDSPEGGALFTVTLPMAGEKSKETVNGHLGPV